MCVFLQEARSPERSPRRVPGSHSGFMCLCVSYVTAPHSGSRISPSSSPAAPTGSNALPRRLRLMAAALEVQVSAASPHQERVYGSTGLRVSEVQLQLSAARALDSSLRCTEPQRADRVRTEEQRGERGGESLCSCRRSVRCRHRLSSDCCSRCVPLGGASEPRCPPTSCSPSNDRRRLHGKK